MQEVKIVWVMTATGTYVTYNSPLGHTLFALLILTVII